VAIPGSTIPNIVEELHIATEPLQTDSEEPHAVTHWRIAKRVLASKLVVREEICPVTAVHAQMPATAAQDSEPVIDPAVEVRTE
jgi:hypothetical protein